MAELAPHLIKFDYVEPTGFEKLAHRSSNKDNLKLNSTPFVDNIDNYYMTDSISNNSNVMARCTAELNPYK